MFKKNHRSPVIGYRQLFRIALDNQLLITDDQIYK